MKAAHYAAMMAYFSVRPRLARALCTLCRVLPWAVACAYVGLVIGTAALRRAIPWPLLVYPALTLAAVEGLRRLFPLPRPYVHYGFTPLLEREDTPSFPSRHSASAAIIALAAASLSPVLGGVMAALALIIGVTRVLVGVHAPRDVVAGFLLALVIGLPGFRLLF